MAEQKQHDQNDVQARVDEFIKRFGELRNELKIDIAAFPAYMPNERGTFDLVVQMQPVDVSNEPVASPFVAKAK